MSRQKHRTTPASRNGLAKMVSVPHRLCAETLVEIKILRSRSAI